MVAFPYALKRPKTRAQTDFTRKPVSCQEVGRSIPGCQPEPHVWISRAITCKYFTGSKTGTARLSRIPRLLAVFPACYQLAGNPLSKATLAKFQFTVKRFLARCGSLEIKSFLVEVFPRKTRSHNLTEQVQSLDELRAAARQGMQQSQADLVNTEAAPPTDNDGGLPADTNGEKATEDKPVNGEPEVKTSPTQGSSEGTKDYWEQYPDEAARRKALNETKIYAAETARKAKELEAKVAELEKSRSEAQPSKVDAKVKEPDPDDVSVDDWISQALSLKEGHTDDQLRIAQVNYEVLKFQKDVLAPAHKAAEDAQAALIKATEAVRDQKAHVTKLKAKAESNSLYADDLKEAIGELRDLEKAHTDADLALVRAENKLEKASKEETRKRLEGRALAAQSVEKLKQKSRETKAQTERAAQEAKAKEESDKAWKTEFEKALKANGLDTVSEKAKKALHAAAYTHVYELSKAGQVTDETDLQVLLKDSFQPYLELKASAPALESAVGRKKEVTDEPGPENRKAKTGEDQPKTLDDWRAAARRGMRSNK